MKQGEVSVHRPVMAEQVVRILIEGEVDLLLDATVGGGSHAEAFLTARGSRARVIGLDRDPEMVEHARARLAVYGDRVRLFCESFAEVAAVLDRAGEATVDGAIFDLGANSLHFDASKRGFSFLSPGPLDMRFQPEAGETAAELLDRLSEKELAGILIDLGDEPRAKRIARAIVAERPLRDTLRLAEVVRRAVGQHGRTHPATRTFQALRMAVNDELGHIERGVPAAFDRLRQGGRMVVLSFHSGEDRLVKHLFRRQAGARLLAKKPLRPDSREVRENPRARSARLRACEKWREEEG